jgi:hemerythrin superfamily protein
MSLKSNIRKATNAVAKALTPDNETDSTDILDTLKHEHDEVKSLLSDLQNAQSAVERKSLVKRIKSALLPHTKAEEKVVYNAVIALKDKAAQLDGHEGYIEHELAAKTLQRLEAITNATSPEHKASGKVLKELVEHHIEEEETNVWKDVKRNFSDDERATMNTAFIAAKRRVKI